MATTTARPFTIFIDEPSSRPKAKKSSSIGTTTTVDSSTGILTQDTDKSTATSSNSNIPPPAPPSFSTACEKENLHPITSVRLGLDAKGLGKGKAKAGGKDGGNENENGRGRSANALATKLFIPRAEKIEKDKPEMKKRRLASSSSSTVSSAAKTASTTTKSTATKGGKLTAGSANGRKPASSRAGLSRKVVEMPKVEEEAAVEAKEKKEREVEKPAEKKKTKDSKVNEMERLKALSMQAQADIDSKCYDLTVSPLADVSKAFEQVVAGDVPVAKKPSTQASPDSEDDLLTKTSSLTVSSRAPSPSPAPLPSVAAISAALEKDKGPSKQFSTPERKEIYAAFTFSSPSPSAKRFAASRGTGGAFAFGDLAFNPGW